MRRTPVLTAVAAVLTLAGCSGSTSKPAAVPTGVAAPATHVASASTKPSDIKHGIGTAIDLAEPAHPNNPATTIHVTLVKVVDPSKPANPYNTIPAGQHQVAMQFRIVNTGHAPYAADPANRVKVHDGEGQTFSADLTPDTTAGPAMDTALTLAAGGTTLGFLTVNMPDGVKISTVEYAATPFGGDIARWTLG